MDADCFKMNRGKISISPLFSSPPLLAPFRGNSGLLENDYVTHTWLVGVGTTAICSLFAAYAASLMCLTRNVLCKPAAYPSTHGELVAFVCTLSLAYPSGVPLAGGEEEEEEGDTTGISVVHVKTYAASLRYTLRNHYCRL